MPADSGVQGDGQWAPAFTGQRPAFRPGNVVSVRHGARSARVTEPLAAELLAGYLEERPDLDWALGTLEALARAEARALLIDRWLTEHSLFDEEGAFRARLVSEWRALERQAANIRHSLGWTPRARAAMVRDESMALEPWVVPDSQTSAAARAQAARWLGGARG